MLIDPSQVAWFRKRIGDAGYEFMPGLIVTRGSQSIHYLY